MSQQHERGRHHDDRAADRERGAHEHPGAKRYQQRRGSDHGDDREREHNRRATDEHRLAGRLELAQRGARDLGVAGAGRGLLAVEAIDDHQREGRTEGQPGHRAQRHADGIERQQMAEQRYFSEARQHADRANRGHDQRGERSP